MNTGYRKIWLEGREYPVHRLAFVYMVGEAPNEVDHIDRNKSNNR